MGLQIERRLAADGAGLPVSVDCEVSSKDDARDGCGWLDGMKVFRVHGMNCASMNGGTVFMGVRIAGLQEKFAVRIQRKFTARESCQSG